MDLEAPPSLTGIDGGNGTRVSLQPVAGWTSASGPSVWRFSVDPDEDGYIAPVGLLQVDQSNGDVVFMYVLHLVYSYEMGFNFIGAGSLSISNQTRCA
jgi:hypothetical protein